MNIFIPTLGRVDRQITWNNLTPYLRQNAVLVVSKDEASEHKVRGRNVLVCPEKGIHNVRQWIMDYAAKNGIRYVCQVDDDIRFQVRRPDMKIVDCTTGQVEDAFFWMRLALRIVPHVALSPRSLGYADPAAHAESIRAMYCVAWDLDVVLKHGARYDKAGLDLMEDFHMTLQLLTAGYPNRVSLVHRVNPGVSNAVGGCSTYRTAARQTAAAQKLAKLYPGIVKLREKKKWQGQGMEGDVKMYDVTVFWKKALKYGSFADDDGAEDPREK